MADSPVDLVKRGDLEKLSEVLEEGEGWDFGKRDEFGRSLLDTAVLLGKSEIVELLIQKGAPVNESNSTGYTALHVGAIWGRKDCMRVLIAGGADFSGVTKHKESAKDLALRYEHSHCVALLDCTEAKCLLKKIISQARELLTDSERIAGKWNKEDKSKVTALCNEKTDWIDRDNEEYSKEEILSQVADFEERYQPHISKLDPVIN